MNGAWSSSGSNDGTGNGRGHRVMRDQAGKGSGEILYEIPLNGPRKEKKKKR